MYRHRKKLKYNLNTVVSCDEYMYIKRFRFYAQSN